MMRNVVGIGNQRAGSTKDQDARRPHEMMKKMEIMETFWYAVFWGLIVSSIFNRPIQ